MTTYYRPIETRPGCGFKYQAMAGQFCECFHSSNLKKSQAADIKRDECNSTGFLYTNNW